MIIVFIALIKDKIESSDNKKPRHQVYQPPFRNAYDEMDALFVLMAGEDGVFIPGAERVLNLSDSLSSSTVFSQDTYRNDDFEDEHDTSNEFYEERYEDEYTDHWGPV